MLADVACYYLFKTRFESVEIFHFDGETGGILMPAKLFYQVATHANGFVYIKILNAARRSGQHTFRATEYNGWLVELFHQAAGHYPDYTLVPGFPEQYSALLGQFDR